MFCQVGDNGFYIVVYFGVQVLYIGERDGIENLYNQFVQSGYMGFYFVIF